MHCDDLLCPILFATFFHRLASQQPSSATRHRLPPNHHLPLAATASTHGIKHVITNRLRADDSSLAKTIPSKGDARTQSTMFSRHDTPVPLRSQCRRQCRRQIEKILDNILHRPRTEQFNKDVNI